MDLPKAVRQGRKHPFPQTFPLMVGAEWRSPRSISEMMIWSCGSHYSLVTAKVQSNESNCIPRPSKKDTLLHLNPTFKASDSLPEIKHTGGKGRLNTSQEDSCTNPPSTGELPRRKNASSLPRQLPTAPGNLIHFPEATCDTLI